MSDRLLKESDVMRIAFQLPYVVNSAFADAVKALPSADRPQEWISCSERLPKKERATYLICTESGYMCSCRWTNDMYGFGSHEWSEWGWHIMDKPQYAKVVAWMEMEPWKGADDE